MQGAPKESEPAQCAYVDSSVWIAVLTQEPSAGWLLSRLADVSQQLITAEWTRTELASALSIKARRKELTQDMVSRMLEDFEMWIPAGLSVAAVHGEDFLLAAKMCENVESKLRGGDALHLAVAQRCQATHIFTLDHHMQRYAQLLGMQSIESYDTKKFTH
jgi:uncharacterized protein